MNRYQTIVTIICCIYSAAAANTIVLNGENDSFNATSTTISETELAINISSLKTVSQNDGVLLELPEYFKIGSGNLPGPNQTILPTYSTMLVVPEGAVLSVIVENDEFSDIANFQLASANDEDKLWLDDLSVGVGFYPDKLVEFEYAGKMRDLHLARLTVYPVQYDDTQKALRVHHNIRIKANHTGGDILPPDQTLSEAFYPIYNSILTNNSLIDDVQLRRGAYWFITPQSYVDDIAELAEWKKAMGYNVRIIPTSEIGSNPNYLAIRNYVLDEYNNAELEPDYICLIGDVSTSTGVDTRSYGNPYGMGYIDTDNYYTFLEGNDYFPELFIGRISVSNSNDLNNYLNKYFGYARTPYMDDTEWYHRAIMVAGSNYQSPRLTKLWIREKMLEHGYTDIDTLLSGWDSSYEINASINQGVTFVNYRGYGMAQGWDPPGYYVSNVYQLNNGPRYGIMTPIVCGTGDYNYYSDCLGEAWIKSSNRGGTGFIGTSNPDTHTRFNNTMDCGIYWGLFEAETYTLAQCELIGKMVTYYAFPSELGRVESHFNHYNDLGEPGMHCWTDIPKQLQVTFGDSVEIGIAGYDVNVADESGSPLNRAYVCIWEGDNIFAGKFTDENGNALFSVEFESAGTMALTVTKPTYIPYETNVEIYYAEIAVGVCSYSVDDDNEGNSSGDGDLAANPTETIELSTMLKNFGSSETATGVTAVLSSDDPYIELIGTTSAFGDISPGDSAESENPYVVSISENAPDNYEVELLLNISETGGGSWQNLIFLPVSAANIEVESVSIQADDNDNEILDRAESAELILEVFNSGSKGMIDAEAVLRTSDPLVQISDSTGYFGDLDVDGSGSNTDDPFALSIIGDLYNGHFISLSLELTAESGEVKNVEFAHMVGAVTSDDPIGPDEYGYYCFDNTDTTYLFHPEYEWINIESSWNYVSIYDDNIQVRPLPFDVQYYGETFDEFSMSDNGYIALGRTWWSNFLNTNIPSPQCAPAMIAPLWDDLGNNIIVRYHHDEDNHWFIIGWNNVRSNDTYQYYTFEIIILDTEYWPTSTGDNEIIFQYSSCPSPYSNSVGICNRVRDIGLQYKFNNIYDHGAATLQSGRAIKFTTGSEYLVDINDGVNNLPETFELAQNYPNPFNATTRISYNLPSDNHVVLEIYNMLGSKVKTLVDQYQQAGHKSVVWDGRDDNNNDTASGIYLYRLKTGGNQQIKKMVLLK